MAFSLSPDLIPKQTQYRTGGDLVLAAGTKFQIRRLGPTSNYADWTVPAGKKWAMSIRITIQETDA